MQLKRMNEKLCRKIKIGKNLWLVSPKTIAKDVPLDWDFGDKIIYGPAVSRRFGLSLGVNLYPKHKFCNFNCVYCLAGKTSGKPSIICGQKILEVMQNNLDSYFANKNIRANIDSIGFCGNGDPTIHPDFKQIARFLVNYGAFLSKQRGKKIFIGAFSNSTAIKKFSAILSKMDILVFKLDAGNEDTFQQINRTKENFEKIIAALKTFPAPFTLSAAVVEGAAISNIDSLTNDFCDIVNTLKNPVSLQLHNINQPTSLPGIKHQTQKAIIKIGKKIACRVKVPVEILADNKYTE